MSDKVVHEETLTVYSDTSTSQQLLDHRLPASTSIAIASHAVREKRKNDDSVQAWDSTKYKRPFLPEGSSVVLASPSDSKTSRNPDGNIDVNQGTKDPLISAEDILKLKRCSLNIELMKLPRFGEKLTAAPDVNRLQKRLSRIYHCKRQAFEWPRYREVSLSLGTLALASLSAMGDVGRLDMSSMSVSVDAFRGGFSQYFGKTHYDFSRQINVTDLTAYEAYFLADAGCLEVTLSENCALGLEDFRALLEDKVHHFVDRYAVFSEFHRATQLYLKNYGTLCPSSSKRKKAKRESDWDSSRDQSEHCMKESSGCSHHPLYEAALPTEFPDLPVNSLPRPRKPLDEARSFLNLDLPQNVGDTTCSLAAQEGTTIMSILGPSTSQLEMLPMSDLLFKTPVNSNLPKPTKNDLLLDLAFTCFSKSSISTPTRPVFDVAITNCTRKDISMADLFQTLVNRIDPSLPLYVARNDNGYLSGVASQLADIPVVCYQGAQNQEKLENND